MSTEGFVTFETNGARIVGVEHRPDGPLFGGMVFCHPFAEEKKCSHRILVDCARALCEDGWYVLRFDQRGCGDSEGDLPDYGLTDWVEDAVNAAEYARRQTGDAVLGLLGLRLGGLLAAEAAERRDDISHLVLWEPVVQGRSYLRLNLQRKRLRQTLTEAEGEARASAPASVRDDGIDFDGYLLTHRLENELNAADLTSSSRTFSGRLAILQISAHQRPSRPLVNLLESYPAADAVHHIVREQPIWNLLDLKRSPALVDATTAWLKGEPFPAQEKPQEGSAT